MNILRLVIVALFLICWADLAAQDDPYGAVDTVYIDNVTASPGKEFSMDVNLWNDEELGAVTITLIYPTDKLEFIDFDKTGRLDYLSEIPTQHDPATGKLLVGAIVIFEDYIQPGRGKLFSMRFKVKDSVSPGEEITVDSVAYSTAASLSLTAFDAYTIVPAFLPGKVTVGAENRPPYFTPIPDVYIAEGDSLYINVEATDPDGDQLTLANPIHPYNSEFTDNGDGTGLFAWRPDYIGPLSSDVSPFTFIFYVSDGAASAILRVRVHIINVNRAPQITAPELIEGEAGDFVSFTAKAVDPDFEEISWEVSGLPEGASFDMNNPGLFEWDSSFDDSGLVTVRFIASDPYGMADTMDVDIDLAPVELFAMQIDTASVYSGESVDIAVYLKNKEAIDRYNVLINADPSVLTVLDVTNDGTRSQDLALFSFRTEDVGQPGDIRVKGSAEGGTPIGEGGGPIFVMRIHVSNNLLYVNNQVPITFALHTSLDNSLTLPNQEIVYDESINLFDGYIFIKSPGPIRIGDVNVNGVPFEIGDAVYFSNFFINPSLYPLDGKQLLNSDVNQDGIAPSIADLVLLVKVVTGETTPPVYPKASTTIADAATVELVHEEDGVYLETSAPVDLSGLLFTVTGPELDRQDVVNLTDMELLTYQRDGRLSALLISYDEKAVRSGDVSVLKISADPKAEISLEDAQLADRDGNPVEVELKKETVLPERFGLYQNFPNPFNPSTEIMFDLSAPSHVRLSVFNILGQEVIRLADKEYPAGRHTVVWDGRNEAGRQVASGVYFYRIKTGETTASRKMVLLK